MPRLSSVNPQSPWTPGLGRAATEPFFYGLCVGDRVEVRGATSVFRGHRLPRSTGTDDGIFAEWQWDGRRLVVRNDRYGFYPLFYFCTAREIGVSTSLIRLLALGAPADIDDDALAVFLRLGYFVGEDTPFRAIRMVPPNARFEWEDSRLAVSGQYCYGPPNGLSREDALDAYIALFRQAIARRLPPDSNFAVPLSGGRDSRHILLELCHQGHPPRFAITIPRYPPRAPEDERVAALVAREVGVTHRLLDQPARRVSSELRKNWLTHLCADEHTWYLPMIDCLEKEGVTVYDGIGGALSVAGMCFLRSNDCRLFEQARFHELAEALLDEFGIVTERFLGELLGPAYRAKLNRDRATERLSAELRLHVDAPDPTKSFNFFNRTRREIALVPYALMNRIRTVFSPFLDHDVYDLLSSLTPATLSPDLTCTNKGFHSDAIRRAHPRFAHIPFEDSHASPLEARHHYAQFGAAAARHIIRNTRRPFTVMNNSYVWPRLAASLISGRFAADRGWLAPIVLYLCQLEAAVRDGTLAALEQAESTDPASFLERS
jgi:asparagine synthase (glutamine-hydrolysing)